VSQRQREAHSKEKHGLLEACADDMQRAQATIRELRSAAEADKKGIMAACAADLETAKRELRELRARLSRSEGGHNSLETQLNEANAAAHDSARSAQLLQRQV